MVVRCLQVATDGQCGSVQGLGQWSTSQQWDLVKVSPARSPLFTSAQQLVQAVQAAGGAQFAVSVLGAPGDASLYPQDLSDESQFNPMKACDWRRVLCGVENSGVLQILADGYEVTAKEGIQTGLLKIPGLLGLGVSGVNGENANPPDLPSKTEVHSSPYHTCSCLIARTPLHALCSP